MEKIIRPVAIGAIVILALISLHFIGWLKPAENAAFKIASPFQRSTYAAAGAVKSFYNSWLFKRDLIAENGRLMETLAIFQVEKAKIVSLEEENNLLKQELTFLNEKKFKFVEAKIVGGVSDPVSRSVVINRGSRDGIENGLAVISGPGVLIGKIIEVNRDSSKVLLLTDNKSKVAATVQNADRTAGLVEGQFGLSFAMTNIPQNQEIKENDLIVTSGLEGKIPKNLLIAKVESVSQIESEIFKTASLGSIISFDNLSYITVIIP